MNNTYDLAIKADDSSFPKIIQATDIPDLLIYERETFSDGRGFFREIVELRDLEKVLGKKIEITQWNHSKSKPNVIRGFHAEPWEKIVYVAKGNVIAAIIDLRTDSPTFGKAVKVKLSENDKKTLYLPKGMGNSFCVVGENDAEYFYMITGYFEGEPTPGVFWNDPQITKQFGGWPIKNPIVSKKDAKYPTLKEKYGDKVDFSKFSWLND